MKFSEICQHARAQSAGRLRQKACLANRIAKRCKGRAKVHAYRCKHRALNAGLRNGFFRLCPDELSRRLMIVDCRGSRLHIPIQCLIEKVKK